MKGKCPLCKAATTKRSLCIDETMSEMVSSFTELRSAFEVLSQQPIRKEWNNNPVDNLSQLYPYPEKASSSKKVQKTAKPVEKAEIVETKGPAVSHQEEFEFPVNSIDLFRSDISLSSVNPAQITEQKINQINNIKTRLKGELDAITLELNLRKSEVNLNNHDKSSMQSNDVKPNDYNVFHDNSNNSHIVESKAKRQRVMKVICCSGLSHDQKKLVATACKNLKDAIIRNDLNAETTHLIVNLDENMATSRTMKYFEAVARGLWIVSPQWIEMSIERQKWVDETLFECLGDKDFRCSAPTKSRLGRQLIFKNQRFNFQGTFKSLKSENAINLSKLCGAEITDDTDATTVIVGIETSKKDRELINKSCQVPIVSVVWILDCISNWKTMPIIDYKID